MKKVLFLAVLMSLILLGCHDDDEEIKPITGIKFQESTKLIYAGDEAVLAVVVSGNKGAETVRYSVSREGIVDIKQYSNDGVTVYAKQRGTVVISAVGGSFTDYCNITVGGSDERLIPHIITSESVMELSINERRNINVSLAGGTPADNSSFVWSVKNGDILESFETTGAVCVFETARSGNAVINVHHPKAQYSVEILIFVNDGVEQPVYITSVSPILNIKKEEGPYTFKVQLVGAGANENYGFIYQVIEGTDVVQLQGGNTDTATIMPKKAGIALIRVNHTKAYFSYEVQAVVTQELDYKFIEVGQSLVLMEEGSFEYLTTRFNGDVPADYRDKYNFSLSENGVVEITESQGLFGIRALKKGKVVLKIENEYADFAREVLIVVSDGTTMLYSNEKYITTSQNVITMEVGGEDAVLDMLLTGGNEADKNSFVWYVEDSGIIGIAVGENGKVTNDKLPAGRAQVNLVNEQYRARVIVTPKKAGTSRIVVEHPKAKNDCVILVKVYPKNTFASVPVVLTGLPYYKSPIGEITEVTLYLQSGSFSKLGNVTWGTENSEVAEAQGSANTGTIRAKKSGITTLVVSGGNLKIPFRALIIAADRDEMGETPFIYVNNPYINLTIGQSFVMPVMSENIRLETVKDLVCENSNEEAVKVTFTGGAIGLLGKDKGISEITVKGEGINEIKIIAYVEEEKIDADYPYYLSSDDKIIGLVKENDRNITVNLVGASEISASQISWRSDNESVIKVTGNGRTARIEAKGIGQTVIKAAHAKSKNALSIAIYVVLDETELSNKVVFYLEKNNYLIERGERVYIDLVTNATDEQKKNIAWKYDNADVVNLSVSGDNKTVLLQGVKPGLARITVNHPLNLTGQVIYISVVERKTGLKYIGVPSIIEGIAGNNISINAVGENIDDWEKQGIKWSISNNKTASIAGNGLNCLVQLLNSGNAVITLKQEELNIAKNIMLYVYENYQEMSSSYVMGAEESYYNLTKGDVIEASLVFGSKGFPEHEIDNIRWEGEGNGVVKVTGNGKKARIEAVNEGVAHITASSGAAKNGSVTIEVEVREIKGNKEGYNISIKESDRVIGLVKNTSKNVNIKVYNGITEITGGLDKLSYEITNSSVVSISQVGDFFRITAKEKGISYLTISYPQAESEKIYIYVENNENDLQTAYPLVAERTNYLLKKGKSESVYIRTADDDPAKLANVDYALEKNNGSIRIVKVSAKEILVEALNKGNEVIIAKYKGREEGKIYVSVTETAEAELSTYLITENIIALLKGEEYETKVNTDLPQYARGAIYWETENGEIAELLNYTEERARIKAQEEGRAYLRVRAGSVERKVLVVVCKTANELENIKAVNIEQRYFIINSGQTLNINIHGFKGKIYGNTIYSDYYESETLYANILEEVEKSASKIAVKGKEEGVACIRVKNEESNFDELVYVEVRKKSEGQAVNYSKDAYITIEKTLYILEERGEAVLIKTNVIAKEFYQSGYYVWDGYDVLTVELDIYGNYAYARGLKKGQTTVKVSNIYCENILEITIIVGEKFTQEVYTEPYIYAAKTVFEYNMRDETDIISYEIRNESETEKLKYKFIQTGDSVKADTSVKGKITVSAQTTGITTLRLKKENKDIYLDFYFIVREGDLNKAIYLTTGENYIITSLNEVKYADIRLEGYTEIDSTKFKWSISDSAVAQVVGNGTRGQIYPVSEGNAVITVKHEKAKGADLSINLKVTKKAGEKAVYLTTPMNVVEVVVSQELNYIYIEKIGGDESKKACTWRVDDPSILTVSGNSLTGMYTVKRAGTAKITVTCEGVENPLQIVVIAKEPSGSNLYIETANSLIMMSPGTTNRRIEVSLAGGALSDNNKFNWTIYHQQPQDVRIAQNYGNVISITGNGNQCNINAVNDGIAKIRVTHEKADNPLYITIYVTRYNDVEFPVKVKEMAVGTSEFLELRTPTYENFNNKVYFHTDNPAVATVVGTSKSVLVSAHGEGLAIITAWVEGREEKSELYVTVKNDYDHDAVRVVTGQTSFSFNPRSNPQKLEAKLLGPDIIDSDNDEIMWSIKGDNCISIFPAVGKGRSIEITPRMEGICTIQITHNKVEEKYIKSVYVIVTEAQEALTLDKNYVVLKSGKTENLKATIVGGRQSDYDELVWYAEWFDTGGMQQEVVSVMGQGRQIILFPKNIEGEITVHVYYRSFEATCKVKVELEAILVFEVGTIRKLIPGYSVEVGYQKRPMNAVISWSVVDTGKSEQPIVEFFPMDDVNMVKITALREGNATIRGLISTLGGVTATLNVEVKYSYSIEADDTNIVFEPHLENDRRIIINYHVYPADTTVKIENKPGQSETAPNVMYDITQPDSKGNGVIEVISRMEFKWTILLVQYLADGITKINNSKPAEITMTCKYDKPIEPTLYFVKGQGEWTNNMNPSNSGTMSPIPHPVYKTLPGTQSIDKPDIKTYSIELGDGESHYILFDKGEGKDNAYFNVSPLSLDYGVLPKGVEVVLVELEYNGIKQPAIRLSGGKDIIKYTRVKFDHDLFIDVNINGTSNVSTTNVMTTTNRDDWVIGPSNGSGSDVYFTYKNLPGSNLQTTYDYKKVLEKKAFTTDSRNWYVISEVKYDGYRAGDKDGRSGIAYFFEEILYQSPSLILQDIVNASQGGRVYYKKDKNIYWEDSSFSDYYWKYLFCTGTAWVIVYNVGAVYFSVDLKCYDRIILDCLSEYTGGGKTYQGIETLMQSFGGSATQNPRIFSESGGGREPENSFRWESNWSRKYYIARNVSIGDVTGYYNQESYGQNRIRWERIGATNKAIDISTFNDFPFMINGVSCFNSIENPTGEQGTHKVTSVPMPTIDTSPKQQKTATYTISYKTFNSDNKFINLEVKYVERDSHMNYRGGSYAEIEGITDWDKLTN